MIRRILQLGAALLLAAGLPAAAPAQQVDVIRGQVLGPENQPVDNAQVVVTSMGGNVNRNGRTDRNGRFSITFPNGDGNYMVTVTAIGYAVRRFEVRRVADEDFLLADTKLQRVGATLDAVNVQGQRDRVARNANEIADISGTERVLSTAGLPPDMIGDLAAMAATLPGMQAALGADGANGFSAFGLGADQNNTTLNGMNFGGAGLPRDARVGSSVVSSPWDVSRGGFSGAQTMLRTVSGTNFQRRRGSSTLDAPSLQWTDQIGRSLGNEYTNFSLGGSAEGPLKFDKAFYNVSGEVRRRANGLQTLLNTDPSGLQAAGVARDSVSRLTQLLNGSSIPSDYDAMPGNRNEDRASFLGSFDFSPPSSTRGDAWNLTASMGWTRNNPATDFFSSTTRSLPTVFGERTSFNGALQARHSSYFGFGILTETSLGVSTMSSTGDPYVDLPSGRVRVNSDFNDGTSGVQMLTFGGGQALQTSQSATSFMAMNQLSWFSANNKHRLKLTSELRHDANTQDNTVNRLGTYTYNSLADLENGVPAMFTRSLLPRKRDASQVVGAISLGDSYRRSQNFQLQYGVRVDANRFLEAPAYNDAVFETFGVRNDNVPNRILVSPRVGFSWMYGTAAQIGAFEGAFRGPRAVLRGGIGIFQNQPTANLVGSAIDNTGLPTGIQQLVCVGSAIPAPSWSQFVDDPSSVPDRCADGSTGTGLASGVPNVSMFADNYTMPRSVRSTLGWSGPILNARFNAGIDGTFSYNMQQTAQFDRNFTGTSRFTLDGEGGRPVYANATGIVPTTGAIAAAESRLSTDFNRVMESRSDLTSMTRQVTARISPMRFNNNFGWNLAYTYANMREQFVGFQSAAGDPMARGWSRGSFDSRHQFIYGFNYNLLDFVRINWFGTFRSGTPYTPMVGGDINGDGSSNDRAFVFDPAAAGDETLRAGMRSLLDNGSRAARECLDRQMGTIAARNSCQGPWTQTASLTLAFNPLKVRMPQRARLQFSIQNPLGAADMLVNGENNMKGWGQTPNVDPSLLYVRGFDPLSKQFKYEVNQRFGASNPQVMTNRNPVVATAWLSFDLGPATERQLLQQSLDRGRRLPGSKTVEGMLRAQFANPGVPNPFATLLRDQDTLKLSAEQADSLASMNRRYLVKLDSIWSPVVRSWASLPDDYDHGQVYGKYRRAREASIDVLMQNSKVVKNLLSDEQYRRLPPFIAQALDARYLRLIRSSTAGSGLPGGTGGAAGGGVQMVMIGGGGGGGQVIMR